MVRDGKYAAWFRTPRGAGTGIVHLLDGRISGGDSYITYGGSYKIDGDRFIATLTTKRHTAGQPTVFGIDEVELKLTGILKDSMAICSGSVDEVPGMVFEATLILSRDEQPKRQPTLPVRKFNVEKLPRGLRSR
jgi:hypothetical protein